MNNYIEIGLYHICKTQTFARTYVCLSVDYLTTLNTDKIVSYSKYTGRHDLSVDASKSVPLIVFHHIIIPTCFELLQRKKFTRPSILSAPMSVCLHVGINPPISQETREIYSVI